MRRTRLPGVLWIIAGLSSAGIAFFITDPPTLATFVVGAVGGVMMGIGLLTRPSDRLLTWSVALGATWLVGFGIVSVLNIGVPVEELLSVVWVLAFGVAAAIASFAATRDLVTG